MFYLSCSTLTTDYNALIDPPQPTFQAGISLVCNQVYMGLQSLVKDIENKVNDVQSSSAITTSYIEAH